MAKTYTPNINLEKDDENEFYDVGVQTRNMDKIDTEVNKKANLNGGNQFVGAQNIENGSFAQKATSAQTANKRWFSWYINTASYYLSAVNDAGAFVRNLFEIFHDGGMRILGNLTVDGTLSVPQTVTTITSGFAAGFSGVITAKKSFDKLMELTISVDKSTDIAGGNLIYTLPLALAPTTTIYTKSIVAFTSGGAIMSLEAVLEIGTAGTITVFIASGSNVNFRKITGVKLFYYTA